MGFDRNAVLRPQHAEIERGHDAGERSGGCLMPSDFQTIDIGAQMIGIVDGPACEPQHLALELAQNLKLRNIRSVLLRSRHRLLCRVG
jgi:hypothetical protein